MLRGFDYCIVDEVDSILIDEARTPLIISGQSDKPSNKYEMTQKLAAALERDYHYTVDEKQKNVLLTEDGYEAAEQVLQVCSWLFDGSGKHRFSDMFKYFFSLSGCCTRQTGLCSISSA